MPSKKQYNLVQNDENDTRIPLHSEEAFHRGITFHAKFIGSMEVPRPTSRMEIVAAMRRIRYEFKAKGTKKKKVTLDISVDGLKVVLRKKKKQQQWIDESKLILMHHPIYRIFYVSHDSHDLKIFSYIARDGTNNSFRCNVFKSSKKSQAMRVVRTVGQAFEVCHKLSMNVGSEDRERSSDNSNRESENRRRDDDYDDRDDTVSEQQLQASPSSVHKDISLLGDIEDSILDQPNETNLLDSETSTGLNDSTPLRRTSMENNIKSECSNQHNNVELTALKHEIQLLKERLDQQSQQTRAAMAHARLLQDQLAAETTARIETQARTHQLLVQNKELLEHIAVLVSHLREQERRLGVPFTVQAQIPSTTSISQSTGVADLSSLGQSSRTSQSTSSTWKSNSSVNSSILPFDYINCRYTTSSGIQTGSESIDETRYQSHCSEKLRYAPYNTPSTASRYSSVAPSARKNLNQTLSPAPTQHSSLPSTPLRIQKSEDVVRSPKSFETTFAKPLPCKCGVKSAMQKEIERNKKLRDLYQNAYEKIKPLLETPPHLAEFGSNLDKSNYVNYFTRGVQTENTMYSNVNVLVDNYDDRSESSNDSMPKLDECAKREDEVIDKYEDDYVNESICRSMIYDRNNRFRSKSH